MQSVAGILLLIVATGYCIPRPEEEKYTTKYDNIDVDEILQSERLLKNYMNCLLDKGRCTPAGLEIKKNLPDGLKNACAKCSEFQRKTGQKVLKFLIEEKRDYYDQLEAKYDPDGIYRKRYQADLEAQGIKL